MQSGWIENKRLWLWAALLAAALTLLAAWQAGWPRPVESLDERQSRLDMAAPLPAGDLIVEQTFVAQHDGLSAVELLLVVYPSDGEPEPGARLTARLLDEDGEQLSAASWPSAGLVHNDPLRFAFPPLRDSASRVFRLQLEGTVGNRATVWAYSLDGYARGEMRINGDAQRGDLRFETSHRYGWSAALRDLSEQVAQSAGLFAVLTVLLLLPGLALLPRADWLGRDPAVGLGVALAGGLALLPLIWLWGGQLGGRMSGALLWGLLVAATLLVVWRWDRYRPRWHMDWVTMALAAVLLLGLAVRMLAIRDLVLPAWVDSPQHYLISRMMADGGRVPAGYRPWMPVDGFDYHFGFHALAASLHQMTGRPLVQILLAGGQWLQGLVPLAVYAGTVLLTGRRPAGLMAAFFVALLSLFPAYYLTWGRYTQLAGMLILPALMGWLWRLFAARGRSRAAVAWGALLLGGLFTVHARVWVFALVWLPVAALGALLSRRITRPRLREMIRRPAVVLGASALAALPWWVRVVSERLAPLVGRALAGGGDPGGYNDVPWGYLTYGWERVWLALAAVALLGAVVQLWRQPAGQSGEGAQGVALVAIWVIAVLAAVNSDQIGVPTFGLVNNNAWFISLFFPLAVSIGWLVDDWLRSARGLPLLHLLTSAGLACGLVWSGLYGVRLNADIVNQETVLVRPDDLELLNLAAETLPPDAVVAVNSWLWLGDNYWAGSDSGYWLLPLSGRSSTVPPIGYHKDPATWDWVLKFNRQLQELEDWDAEEALALLHSHGVTHVVIGERGGVWRPERLMASPHFQLVAGNGAAWLFEVPAK